MNDGPMTFKRTFTWAAEVLFLLSMVIGLVYISGQNSTAPRFLAFDGVSPAAAPIAPAPDKIETFLHRNFTWKDSKKKDREVEFMISETALKKEIKAFGSPKAMLNTLFMEKRGFKVIGRRNYIKNRQVLERLFTMVDYKKIFQGSLKYFPEYTRLLTDAAEVPEGTDPLRPFLSFIQQIRYQRPPDFYKRKFIGSFFVPLVCLFEQYGDCDSKSVLLAEFLATLPESKEKVGMVLIRGNGLAHALLGVKRKPFPGMTSLYFRESGYYIVVETTTPGWSPGFVDRRITDALKAGLFQFIPLN